MSEIRKDRRRRRPWRRCVVAAMLALAACGQAAAGTAAPASAVTVPVASSGGGGSCALMPDLTTWCWGSNATGQLGNGTTTDSAAPVGVSGLTSGVVAIAAGDVHACAALLTGRVECWGDNTAGQLGNGSIGGGSTTPVPVSGFASNGAIGITGGTTATSCALSTAQVAECWGNNADGELGDGSTTDSGTPVVVQGL